jgi:hypothetical protein
LDVIYLLLFQMMFRSLIARPLPVLLRQRMITVKSACCLSEKADAYPVEKGPSYASTFKLERQVFVASLPLLPAAYFVHGPVMDALLTVAIVANCHL